jgi:hypothetical protein
VSIATTLMISITPGSIPTMPDSVGDGGPSNPTNRVSCHDRGAGA